MNYLESKGVGLWARQSEELDEGIRLIEVDRGVVRRRERLSAKRRSDESRVACFDGQDR